VKKVVYNARHGGFGLSLDALYALLMLGFPLTSTPLEGSGYTIADFPRVAPNGVRGHKEYGYLLKDGVMYSADLSHTDMSEVALRSHPILVTVVEKLGERANAEYARLAVEEIGDGDFYTIDEYDGYESVRIFTMDNYTAGHLMTALEVPNAVFTPLLTSDDD
jgi:hypothetical protein